MPCSPLVLLAPVALHPALSTYRPPSTACFHPLPSTLPLYRCLAQVLLMSRDELSMLVASYADVRRCISGCYEELRSRASALYPGQQLGGGGVHRSRSRPNMQQQGGGSQQY